MGKMSKKPDLNENSLRFLCVSNIFRKPVVAHSLALGSLPVGSACAPASTANNSSSASSPSVVSSSVPDEEMFSGSSPAATKRKVNKQSVRTKRVVSSLQQILGWGDMTQKQNLRTTFCVSGGST